MILEAGEGAEPRDLGAEVDQATLQLMAGFEEHYEEAERLDPEIVTRETAFRAWVIQRIAALQLSLTEVAKGIEDLVRMSS
ncbi:MAG: hypothetical protein ACYTFI_03475 [Planctomycetota bacterium]